MGGDRANRDAAAVAAKRARLSAPHVAPLTGFVRGLRAGRGRDDVPWFDPDEAGIGAWVLLLLEAPGRRATAGRGSGFVSPDNDDPTAANLWAALAAAGVDRRREVVTWNVVPWYLGDATRIRAAAVRDLDEARPALRELLALLPHLRVAVLLGRKAAAGWRRAGIELPALEAPHPSPQVLHIRPEARTRIAAALAGARDLAGG